ncbi:MAG: hypothetical protein KME45_24395 [Stenomitos rutilans HA7619-LM2]|jgi:hypothetical protein|nr:hypothetical protein [Stenomitos rutilans HA7619-LM2]
MQGIQFLVDRQGRKTAVVIDLEEHSELWEDIYDAWLARSREDEPRELLEDVKQRLLEQGKLSD